MSGSIGATTWLERRVSVYLHHTAFAAAWAGNDGSLGVSRRVGYRENGVVRKITADGEALDEIQVRLLADDLVRPPYPVHATNVAAFCASIGL